MYTKHFFRMLIRLIGMAILGIAILVFINHYQRATPPPPSSDSNNVPTQEQF